MAGGLVPAVPVGGKERRAQRVGDRLGQKRATLQRPADRIDVMRTELLREPANMRAQQRRSQE
jgi:hypothetical protein